MKWRAGWSKLSSRSKRARKWSACSWPPEPICLTAATCAPPALLYDPLDAMRVLSAQKRLKDRQANQHLNTTKVGYLAKQDFAFAPGARRLVFNER